MHAGSLVSDIVPGPQLVPNICLIEPPGPEVGCVGASCGRHRREAERAASVFSLVRILKAVKAQYRRNRRKQVLCLQRMLGPVGEKVLWFCRALEWEDSTCAWEWTRKEKGSKRAEPRAQDS